MPVIKRYPNRKLYDTEAKQYITLDEIAGLIRSGKEVQIIDNSTGEDLTALTLSQVIFEQEKKQSGFLPRSVLSGLIQTGGQRLSSIQNTLAATLGLTRQMDEEIERRIQVLVAHKELTPEEGARITQKLLSLSPSSREEREPGEAGRLSDSALEKLLSASHVPSRGDIDSLNRQLDELTAWLDEIESKKP